MESVLYAMILASVTFSPILINSFQYLYEESDDVLVKSSQIEKGDLKAAMLLLPDTIFMRKKTRQPSLGIFTEQLEKGSRNHITHRFGFSFRWLFRYLCVWVYAEKACDEYLHFKSSTLGPFIQ